MIFAISSRVLTAPQSGFRSAPQTDDSVLDVEAHRSHLEATDEVSSAFCTDFKDFFKKKRKKQNSSLRRQLSGIFGHVWKKKKQLLRQRSVLSLDLVMMT